MCSIIGSFSKKVICDLSAMNQYRGEYSHSISYINKNTNKLKIENKDLGFLPRNKINIPEDCYCICHQQAPTTAHTSSTIHPAEYSGCVLWHNGILKEEYIRKYGSDELWDTKILLKLLANNKSIDDVDGSFACVYYDKNKLIVFRNEIAPLFFDSDLNISSTKFDNSKPLEPNIFFEINLKSKEMTVIKKFKTYNNPYYI